jgi:hypothetical protein
VITPTARALLVTMGLLALVGCGGPRDSYAQTPGSYLKLPGQWQLFSGSEIVTSQDPSAEVPEGIDMQGFAIGEAPVTSVLNSSDDLAGLLLNSPIPEGVTKDMDRAIVITNLNDLIVNGGAGVVSDFTTFDAGADMVGERATFDVPDTDGDVMRLTQITVTDEQRTQVRVLIVGCNTVCHERHLGLMEKIITTWKVEL